jgi:hypothetical protein
MVSLRRVAEEACAKPRTGESTGGFLGHVRAHPAVRGLYKDRFVNGQVAGVIRVSVPFQARAAP